MYKFNERAIGDTIPSERYVSREKYKQFLFRENKGET